MQGSQKLNNKRQDVFINLFQNAEPGMLSCVHVIIDTDSFQEDMIELPQSGQKLPLTRHFKHDARTNVYLYDDKVECYCQARVQVISR